MLGKDSDTHETAGGQTSVMAQGCRFEGKVHAVGTLRVEGEFRGEIETPELLVIGKTGAVQANVRVKNAVIAGQLFGNIIAENKIELQGGSHVEGDIKTKRLVIDEGVFFEGNCSMGGPKQAPGGPAATPRPPQPGAPAPQK
ncbi:polymer-forming cytoskeletal protein [bacterium]|nr:polymer-forming cytoskeletal protein [bacterium]NTV03760.1 polymer-forming cytoskeletal protein [bacterium]